MMPYCFLLLFQSAESFSTQSNVVWRPRISTAPHLIYLSRRTPSPSFPFDSHILFSTTSNNDNNKTEDDDSPTSSSLTSEIAPQLQESKVGNLLLPLAQALEDSTDGWALTYADLSPETHTTPVGIGFLATNLAYTLCGLLLVSSGNVFLGVLTELASVASFAYHFTQLKLGKEQPLVRVALLVDYVVASATLLAALVYIIQVGVWNVPWQGVFKL